MKAIQKIIPIILLFALATTGFAQKKKLTLGIKQDSSIVNSDKLWMNLNFVPSLTSGVKNVGIFLYGPTVDLTYITPNYGLIKLKTAYHSELIILQTPQESAEINLMTGIILKSEKKATHEFYFGLGITQGIKRYDKPQNTNSLLKSMGFDFDFNFDPYIYKSFTTISIPLEYKYQWKIFSLGIDANLNPELPYLGYKWSIKLGGNYQKSYAR